MEQANNIIVVNAQDGKKYKMVLKGDLGLLTVGKVKRYLHQATGIDPACMVIRFNNRLVTDGQSGSEIGLFDGAVMYFDINPQQQQQQQQQQSLPHEQAGGSSFHMGTPISQRSPGYGGPSVPLAAPLSPQHSDYQPVYQGRSSPDRRLHEEMEAERIRQVELDRYRRDLERVRDEERSREREKARQQEEQQQREEQERRREAEMERVRQEEAQRSRARQQELEHTREQARLEEMQRSRERVRQEEEHMRSQLSKERQQLEEERQRLESDRIALQLQETELRGKQNDLQRASQQVEQDLRAVRMAAPPAPLTVAQQLQRNLDNFAAELRVASLQLDSNNTCAVTVDNDQYTLLVTFDPATDRLYLYSTILSSLPADPPTRLRLYETLLGGALLGRDMAGGGVGVSLKNNLVLLSTSIDLRNCTETSLRAITPTFVASVNRWNKAASEICFDFTQPTAHPQSSPQAASMTIGGATPMGADPMMGSSSPMPQMSSPIVLHTDDSITRPPASGHHYGGAPSSGYGGSGGSYAQRHVAAASSSSNRGAPKPRATTNGSYR